jgi:signal transduction histidine kinase/Tfp pilus assembly protein PilF
VKNKIGLILIILVSFHQLSYAQKDALDSLSQLLSTSIESTNQVDILNSLVAVSPNPDSVISASIALAQKLDYEEGLATAYNILSNILANQGAYDSALTINFLTLEFKTTQEPTSQLASVYSAIGLLYDYKGDYQNAMIYFLKGLTVSESLQDKKHISNFYNRIGIIYNYQGNYEKSLEYFNKSLELRKEINDKQGQAEIYNNLGIIYGKKSDIDKAIEYYKEALHLKEELNYSRSSTASSYNNLGTAYFHKSEFNKALAYYEQSLKIKLEENLSSDVPSSYINIGETYMHLGDNENALVNIKQGLALAQNIGNRDDIKLGYEELAQVYAGMNNFREAYQYHVLFNNLKDSIFNTESNERIVEMQTKYEVDKKEQEIILLQKENQIKHIEAENSIYIRNIFMVGFIIISFLVVAIIKNYRHDLTKNQQLSENKVKIESQNEDLRDLSYEKDQLMKIVAHDLRSPLNQIEGLVNLVNYHPENLIDEQKDALSGVFIATKQSKDLIRKVLTTKSVDPSQLKVKIETVDIATLIESTIKDHKINTDRKSIQVNLDIISKEPTALVDINYAEHIFENLISNAIKFSPHEKNIHIKILDDNMALRVEIKDEGPGFTEDDKSKIFGVYKKLSAAPTGGESSTGLGLSIVKKYVSAIKGKVWCESEHGNGATFIVDLPKY